MDPYRLPDTVVPTHYELTLEPDLERAAFRGQVILSIDVRLPSSEVVLNAADLEVFSATFLHPGGTEAAGVALDTATERCHLRFSRPLPAGPAQLHLRFAGTLNDKLRGFYRSRYRDASGKEQALAVTQFEATDARRAFPCFDEPRFKAVFRSTLVVDPGLVALSNTSVVSEELKDGKRHVRFAETIPMSTYLVAFVVGRLEATEPVLVGDTPVRVWCVPGKTHLMRFGHEAAVFSLRYYEEYYGRKYPGDKLDLIAIPDFAAGAMENLGAVTFRETALLVDEATATHAERERVADVVAHENAHMWFGDLVTMRWWNGLWLNEAFATFLEMMAVDAWQPAWRRWDTFGASRASALAVDGLRSSRPVEFPVASPQDAEAMFDVLTYEKGASVLRMLEQYLGPATFQAGVRAYLDRHAFGNTETEDLWNALGGVAELPVREVMDGWVFQAGYPLLTARREGGELVLRQTRFSYLPPQKGEPPRRWQVPVQVRVETPAGAEVRRVLLTAGEARLPLPGDARLVLVNAGGHGFYRVRYGPALLAALLDRLPALAAIERFNLVNDAWAAALAGLMPLTDYLDLTSRFQAERDRNVWSVLLASFTTLARVVEEADRPWLQQLVRERLAAAVAALGWHATPGEDELTGQLRGDLLRAAGTLGEDAAVQAQAALVFAGGQAPASVQAAAVAVLAHTGGAARYDDFVARMAAAGTPQEEMRYLQALAAFRPAGLVERTLAKTLDGSVRTQDAPMLLRTLLLGVHSREEAWAFVRRNWDEMVRRFPAPGMRRLCEGVVGLTSERWEQEAQEFFGGRQTALGGKALEQFLEQLHVAVELRRREGKALDEYLARRAAGK